MKLLCKTLMVKRMLLLAAIVLWNGCSNKDIIWENRIPDLNGYEKEITIKKWQLLGPFFADYSLKYKWEPIDYDHFTEWNTTEKEIDAQKFLTIGEQNCPGFLTDTQCLRNVAHHVEYYPTEVHKILSTTIIGNNYASCTLHSEIEQDVALLVGSDDGIKIWVNHELCGTVGKGGRAVKRNSNIYKAHLKKGENFVLLKLNNSWYGEGFFYVNVASLAYAGKHIYKYQIHANFLNPPVIGKNDSLIMEANPAFIDFDKALVQIFNSREEKVLEKTMQGNDKCKVSLNSLLKEGLYKCRVVIKDDTLEQKFIIGNYREIFKQLIAKIQPYYNDTTTKINAETLINRVSYLEIFGEKYQYDKALHQKIVNLLFELECMAFNIENKSAPFLHVPGLHLRGFVSGIDNHVENYMIYIPDAYKKGTPLPLVVIVPWIGGTRQPFTESMHVADQDMIELYCQVAKKHGFGVLWTSSRIYEKYNLNPIVNAATFETLEAVKREYTIDMQRLYAFGSCSGGLFALLLANRYPSLFAAVGVEGPAITYMYDNCVSLNECAEEWLRNNSMLNHLENFTNFPTYIVQSRHDKKTDFNKVKEMAHKIDSVGGKVILDTIENVNREGVYDFYPREKTITDVFNFFSACGSNKHQTMNLSTSQLKYNQAGWLTIQQLKSIQKSMLSASIEDNTVKIKPDDNISLYSIHVKGLSSVTKKEKLKITTNESTSYYDYPFPGKINVTSNTLLPGCYKNHETEGPVNDIFKSGFIVVQGTLGDRASRNANQVMTMKFSGNWKDNYFADCRIKKDVDITKDDLRDFSLILIGNTGTNTIIRRLIGDLPITIDKNQVIVKGKTMRGNKLGYTFIYPNPENPGKYILLLGCNNNKDTLIQTDLPYKGWFDYEIFHTATNESVDKGMFGINWK